MSLTLYAVRPSPNNMRACIALNYKGLSFDVVDVDPMNRANVVAVSTQPLTPVLVDGETVVFDSRGILRYLEAKFPDKPRLFSSEYDDMHLIEEWELYSRSDLSKPVSTIYRMYISGKTDQAAAREASEIATKATDRLESRLRDSSWLVGDRMTAADLSCAPIVYYCVLPPEQAEQGEVGKYFLEHLKLGEGRDRTREWVQRVMEYCRYE